VPDPDIRLKDARTARVQVAIEAQPVDRRFANVPVRLRNVGPRLTASAVPPVVSVMLRGPASLLDERRTDPADIFLDLAGLGPGSYRLQLKYEQNAGITVQDIEPATVQVRIR
jgi:YbbR domain-containing protein